jgi:hypothetical protein
MQCYGVGAFVLVNRIFLLTSGRSYAAINPKNAAGIWLFDESSGDVDSSGNGNDGILDEVALFGEALRDIQDLMDKCCISFR